jgi:hypothetical protein
MVVYVTYIQNGTKKKAGITEAKYEILQGDTSISELTVYPNARLMEQAASGDSKKRILHG